MLRITEEISEHIDSIRSLFREYAEWMNYEICFDTFEQEIAELPGQYAPPDGFILLAFWKDKPAGCVGLRKIAEKTAEVKRLWVSDDFRGLKIGYSLMDELLNRVKDMDYEIVSLETVPKMEKAIKIYESFGFQVVENNREIIIMELQLFKSL